MLGHSYWQISLPRILQRRAPSASAQPVTSPDRSCSIYLVIRAAPGIQDHQLNQGSHRFQAVQLCPGQPGLLLLPVIGLEVLVALGTLNRVDKEPFVNVCILCTCPLMTVSQGGPRPRKPGQWAKCCPLYSEPLLSPLSKWKTNRAAAKPLPKEERATVSGGGEALSPLPSPPHCIFHAVPLFLFQP